MTVMPHHVSMSDYVIIFSKFSKLLVACKSFQCDARMPAPCHMFSECNVVACHFRELFHDLTSTCVGFCLFKNSCAR
jgi:hypothetical protein